MIHDLSFESFPEGFKAHERWIYSRLVKACARSARHLLTVSEFSKSELHRHWKIPSESVTVTPNGISPEFRPKPRCPEGKPYILAVGNLHPRKNLVRLVEAFVRLKISNQIPHRLRIVGQAAWLFNDIFRSVRRSGMENQVEFTGYLPQVELVKAYQNADLMVYPSVYEGFGLPPLEAMACGCPVVASASTSLPEVCGDAAVLVDSLSPAAIAEGILSVITSDSLSRKLRSAGPAHAALFTWRRCAETTIAAYRRCMQQ